MKLKPGVQAISPHPSILHAMEIVDLYWRATFGREAVITSIRDGVHGPGSLHFGTPSDFREMAFDLRTRDLSADEIHQARLDLPLLLGRAFDIVFESDHCHIERDVSTLLEAALGHRNA